MLLQRPCKRHVNKAEFRNPAVSKESYWPNQAMSAKSATSASSLLQGYCQLAAPLWLNNFETLPLIMLWPFVLNAMWNEYFLQISGK